MTERRIIIARALYEHWAEEEDFGNEYCSWEMLLDKHTWLERARAVENALSKAEALSQLQRLGQEFDNA